MKQLDWYHPTTQAVTVARDHSLSPCTVLCAETQEVKPAHVRRGLGKSVELLVELSAEDQILPQSWPGFSTWNWNQQIVHSEKSTFQGITNIHSSQRMSTPTELWHGLRLTSLGVRQLPGGESYIWFTDKGWAMGRRDPEPDTHLVRFYNWSHNLQSHGIRRCWTNLEQICRLQETMTLKQSKFGAADMIPSAWRRDLAT